MQPLDFMGSVAYYKTYLCVTNGKNRSGGSFMLFCLMFGFFDAPKSRKNQRVRF